MKSYFITIPFFVILTGAVLHLLIPGILAFLVGLFFLLLNGESALWWIKQGVVFFLYLQVASAFVSSGLYGLIIGGLFRKMRSFWVYPVAIVFAFALHYVFLGLFLGGYYLFYSNRINFEIVKYNFIIATIVAPILCIISFLLKKTSDVLEPDVRYETV